MLLKLFTFAVLMAIVPISTYFVTVQHLWNGESTWPTTLCAAGTAIAAPCSMGTLTRAGNTAYAALSAVLAANIVLGGYVYLAFVEDAATKTEVQEKKAQ